MTKPDESHYCTSECTPLMCFDPVPAKADIVQRLRGGVYGLDRIALCHEAADEIERLRDYEWKYKELAK